MLTIVDSASGIDGHCLQFRRACALAVALTFLLLSAEASAALTVRSIEFHNVTTGSAFCGGGTILSGSLRFNGSGDAGDALEWTLRRINLTQGGGPFDLNFANVGADIGAMIPTTVTTTGMGALNNGDVVEVFAFWNGDPAIQSVHYFISCSQQGTLAVGGQMHDALGHDGNSDGRADGGDEVQVTTEIFESGGAAASMASLTVPIDTDARLVPGSLRTTPLARDDIVEVIGNARLSVAAPGLLANDNDPDGRPGLGVQPISGGASLKGGSVSVNADGSFTYDPPLAFQGNDSFVYLLQDGDGNVDQGRVLITVSAPMWFIDNTAAPGGDGRMSTPFNSLAAFNAQQGSGPGAPGAGDIVFVFEGSGSYSGGITLLDGQDLIGQGVDLIVQGQTVTTATAHPTLSNAGGIGIRLAQNNTIRGLSISASGGAALSGTNFGICTMNSLNLSASGHPALSLQNGSLQASCGSVASSGSAGRGISMINVDGRFRATGGTISAAAGTAMFINQGSADIRYDGTITNDAGRVLEISDRSGGTVELNGAISDDDPDGSLNNGVLLQNNNSGNPQIRINGRLYIVNSLAAAVNISGNSGAAIHFGDLDISNSGTLQPGLVAVGGGTLGSSAGTINCGSATGVDIDGLTLAMTLTGVSSNGGTAPGIDLSNTGGAFTVNGDGLNTSLGGNGSGGTIANKTGGSGTATGVGVRLNNVANVALNRMQLNDFTNFAIYGSSVNGFVMDYSTISGANGNSAGDDEGSITLQGLSGSDTNGTNPTRLRRSVLGGGLEDNINILNTAGTLSRLLIDDCTIGANHASLGNDGILIEGQNSASLTILIRDSRFTSARGDLLQVGALHNCDIDLDVLGSAFSNNHSNIISGGGGITLVAGTNYTGNYSYTFDNNTMRDALGAALLMNLFPSSSATSDVNGVITRNDIGLAGVNLSGSAQGNCIVVISQGSATHNVTITHNNLHQYNEAGIRLDHIVGDGTLNATVTSNTIANPGPFTLSAIYILAGGNIGDSGTVCALIEDNSFVGGGGFFSDFGIDQLFNATVNLPGYSGGNNDTAAVIAFVQGNNSGLPTGTVLLSGSGGGVTGTGSSCP